MLACITRVVVLTLALVVWGGTARAGDLADFNAAAEAAESHSRVAIGYLRTGNIDLASIEVDGLRAAWRKLTDRFAGRRPDPFDDNDFYVTAMTDIGMRLVTADMMLKSGRAGATRAALVGVRDNLYRLRKSAGIAVLADCVREANAAMDALMTYNKAAPDWSKSSTQFDIAGKSAVYGHALDRCDSMANGDVRQRPEFRRLVDGAKAGLALMPQAIAARDSNLLHRLLIELRSFDNLLAFRFG